MAKPYQFHTNTHAGFPSAPRPAVKRCRRTSKRRSCGSAHKREVPWSACDTIMRFQHTRLCVWGCLCVAHLKTLDSAFKEHEERRVGVSGLSLSKNGFGLRQAGVGVAVIQGEEGLHYCVVPQEGQAVAGHIRIRNVSKINTTLGLKRSKQNQSVVHRRPPRLNKSK